MARQTSAWKYGNRNRNGNGTKPKPKEKETKFATQEQMNRGAYATYNTVKDIIVQEVQKKYRFGADVAKSIRDGKRFDINAIKPVRAVSTEKDDATNGRQRKQIV